jgi:hypothetical protein
MGIMLKPTSIASLLALAACHGTPPSSGPATPIATDVAGHWTSDCAPTADGKGHFTMEFHDTTAHWQLAYVVFGDAACTTKLVSVDIAGAYEIGAASPVAGAREAVFHFDHKTITPAVQPLADALDAMGCGHGAVGAPRDLYDQGCAGFGQYPKATCSADYDMVWRDGDQLRFGDRPADNNMCSPDRRPTSLSPLVLHRR